MIFKMSVHDADEASQLFKAFVEGAFKPSAGLQFKVHRLLARWFRVGNNIKSKESTLVLTLPEIAQLYMLCLDSAFYGNEALQKRIEEALHHWFTNSSNESIAAVLTEIDLHSPSLLAFDRAIQGKDLYGPRVEFISQASILGAIKYVAVDKRKPNLTLAGEWLNRYLQWICNSDDILPFTELTMSCHYTDSHPGFLDTIFRDAVKVPGALKEIICEIRFKDGYRYNTCFARNLRPTTLAAAIQRLTIENIPAQQIAEMMLHRPSDVQFKDNDVALQNSRMAFALLGEEFSLTFANNFTDDQLNEILVYLPAEFTAHYLKGRSNEVVETTIANFHVDFADCVRRNM